VRMSRRNTRVWPWAVCIAVAGGGGACAGKSAEHRGGADDSRASAGRASGAGATDAGASAGFAGVAATAAEGGHATAHSGGAPVVAGGTNSAGGAGGGSSAGEGGQPPGGGGATTGATGGESGAPGGEAGTNGEGGTGGEHCVDFCSLYGAACCIPELDCTAPPTGCLVEVLAGSVDTSYDYATLEQRIAELPQDLLASFTDADITWAAAEPAPAARMEFHLTPAVAASYGAALEASHNRPFRISCNGQSLFVGVLYYVGGAAALGTPVLHTERQGEDALILRLGAWQGAWLNLGSPDANEARERIDRSELRAALCARGVLQELEAAREADPSPGD
jgi:hypothetical protein